MHVCAGAFKIHSASAQGAELSRPDFSSSVFLDGYVYSPSGTPSAFRYSTCMQGVNRPDQVSTAEGTAYGSLCDSSCGLTT
jgi:hypothetical protein